MNRSGVRGFTLVELLVVIAIIGTLVALRLMTANGTKCVDLIDHNHGVQPRDPEHPIQIFRTAPPLAEHDYQ
jgi:prepilin-type N-terminal cleavage/methylation domain-containing protein